jgi:hypothetical protein
MLPAVLVQGFLRGDVRSPDFFGVLVLDKSTTYRSFFPTSMCTQVSIRVNPRELVEPTRIHRTRIVDSWKTHSIYISAFSPTDTPGRFDNPSSRRRPSTLLQVKLPPLEQNENRCASRGNIICSGSRPTEEPRPDRRVSRDQINTINRDDMKTLMNDVKNNEEEEEEEAGEDKVTVFNRTPEPPLIGEFFQGDDEDEFAEALGLPRRRLSSQIRVPPPRRPSVVINGRESVNYCPKRCWCTRCQIMYRLYRENNWRRLSQWGDYPCHQWWRHTNVRSETRPPFCTVVHLDGSWPKLKSLPPIYTVSDKYEICMG